MNTYEITEKTVKTIIEFVKERHACGAAASGELYITGINSIEFYSWQDPKEDNTINVTLAMVFTNMDAYHDKMVEGSLLYCDKHGWGDVYGIDNNYEDYNEDGIGLVRRQIRITIEI